MSREEIDTLSTLRTLDEKVPVDQETTDRIRTSILARILDEMLEDHLLSEEEEEAIRELIDQLDLPEEQIASEKKRLEHYSRIRREIDRPLGEMDPGVPLVRGEKAYEEFDDTRLLNERVLNRFQRDNVQYRELGYEIDLEGKLILTDRRLLFAGQVLPSRRNRYRDARQRRGLAEDRRVGCPGRLFSRISSEEWCCGS